MVRSLPPSPPPVNGPAIKRRTLILRPINLKNTKKLDSCKLNSYSMFIIVRHIKYSHNTSNKFNLAYNRENQNI